MTAGTRATAERHEHSFAQERSHTRPARLATSVLGQYLRRHPKDTGLLIVWSAVEVLPTFALGRTLDEATNAFLAGRLLTGFGWLGVLIVAAGIGAAGAHLAYGRLAAIVEPLRDDLVRRIVTGAVTGAVAGGPPDDGATARISHQTEIVRDAFGGLVTSLRMFVFVAGSALAGLATLMPAALMITAVPLLAGLVIFTALVNPLIRAQREYVLSEEAVASGATTVMGALRDITACGGESQMNKVMSRRVDAQIHASRAVARISAARSIAVAAGGLLPVPIVLASAPMLLHGGASAGQIVGALAYLTGGLQPALNNLVQGVGSSGVRMAITLDRILEAAPEAEETDEVSWADTPRRRGTRGDVELTGVTFSYGPQAAPAVSDLNLDIPDGEHLAIVGPSGAGKSTLAALITGMLAPTTGDIRLGGLVPYRLDPSRLADRRVLIPQEAYVFDGTLGENLAYLNPNATRSDLDHAVDALGMRSLAERIGGYSADVDPTVLSAGERQLIALTRAYLSPARLVLLDEATCHLDPGAEAVAETAFAEREGTLVVIAHRMSSALRAGRILVLDGDRAVTGTHDTLLHGCDLYRDLFGYWERTEAPSSIGARPSRKALDSGPMPKIPSTTEPARDIDDALGSISVSEPARPLGLANGVGPRPGAGLPDGPGDVVADGPDRQVQVPGDFRVRNPVGGQPQDVDFPAGERAGGSVESAEGEIGVQRLAPRGDPQDGVGDLGRGRFLPEESVRARRDRLA
ncbi:MAG: ABC transporter ATP-binding protein/permease [Streptosporangiales bacterium]|nr:ABC transporter ATP-binding protein/permease [Streptosporangiales bacterium]